jgi:hypothetical protein
VGGAGFSKCEGEVETGGGASHGVASDWRDMVSSMLASPPVKISTVAFSRFLG